jgi:DNA helicase-2/ATP-dependent DNA helicase PcrA
MKEATAGPAYLDRLNPEQREAVEHFEGPILVLAGAGSGKTRVLTTRIAHMIQEHGVDPASVLAVTFTNKAAGEMRGRVRTLLEGEPAGMWIGTFHSIGARLLRRHAPALGFASNFSIIDADQAIRETKRAMDRLNISDKRWNAQAVHSSISTAKNQLVRPAEYARLASDPFSRIAAEVYPEYQRSLKEQNAFDFDDLLVMPVALFEENPPILERYRHRFRFVLVDEYQDTNHAQYRLLQLVASEHGNLMVVGDDDQSIYGWRGADIRNILDFEKDFPGAHIVRLEQNYRSTSNVLAAANLIIAENIRRKGKTLRTDAGPGERLTLLEAVDERDEADWVGGEMEARLGSGATLRDFVVLYRTNAQSRAFEEAFRRRDIPYVIVGGTRFYERREIMDALAYLRLTSNPKDAGAFDRIVNWPRRGIGDTSRARLLTWASERGMTPLEAAERAEECMDLRGPAIPALKAFAGMIERYAALALHLPVGELVDKIITEVGILTALREEGPEGAERADNVLELLAGAHDFDDRGMPDLDEEPEEGLTALDFFLQKVSLLTDVDRQDPNTVAATLMTVHNAKGLEYRFVFLSGLEDGLFPLARAFDDPEVLEEERRLLYVGVTRAERKVWLTWARTRRRAGEVLNCIRSSFLRPLPDQLLDERKTPQLDRLHRTWQIPERPRDRAARMRVDRTPRFDDDDGSGVYIDYSDAQDTPRFLKGERVRHPQFGRGTIRELSGFGNDVKAVIDFERVGRKKVVLRYANLQKEL